MTNREKVIVGLMILAILIALGLMCQGAAYAQGADCIAVADIQPDETEARVEYTDPQGRELCRLKIYLHDRTVLGFAPPGGEHDGYAAAFQGSHVQGHRTDPNVDLISHAQVFAIENSVTATPTQTQQPPTDTATATRVTPTETATGTEVTPTATETGGPPATPTATPGVTSTPTGLIPPLPPPPGTYTPTATSLLPPGTPGIPVTPGQPGTTPPGPGVTPVLPQTGMDGQAGGIGGIVAFGAVIGLVLFAFSRKEQ